MIENEEWKQLKAKIEQRYDDLGRPNEKTMLERNISEEQMIAIQLKCLREK